MSCFKCGSDLQALYKYQIQELAKGSPTRGKNVKWVTVKVTELKCNECQSSMMTYS